MLTENCRNGLSPERTLREALRSELALCRCSSEMNAGTHTDELVDFMRRHRGEIAGLR